MRGPGPLSGRIAREIVAQLAARGGERGHHPRMRDQPTAALTPPGSAALRSIGLTSGPRPPLEISASRSVRWGNCQKNCIATPPP